MLQQSIVNTLGWPAIPQGLAAQLITPHDAGYALSRSSYMAVGSPALVVMAEHEEHAQEAIAYAAQVRRSTAEHVKFSVRSGGHGIAGSSTNDGGIILDTSRMNSAELIDIDEGIFRAQSGATWGTIANLLAPHDLALTSGNFGDTGVGGLGTAGGVGYFARSQGLTIDHVLRARLITADGSIRWVDASHDPDLFWAVRGGATHAGVVTELEFDAPRLNSATGDARIIHQQVTQIVSDLPAFTAAWGQWIRSAPREMESFLMIQRYADGQIAVQARNVWANDQVIAARPTLQAALELAPVVAQQAELISYPQLVPSPGSAHVGQQRIKMRDVLVDQVNAPLGEAILQALDHRGTLIVELRALGAAVSDIPTAQTAWASRHQEALVASWLHPLPLDEQDAAFAPLQLLGTGSYGAYSSDIRASAAHLTWPGTTGAKLKDIAQRVDPHHLFDQGLTLTRNP